MKVNLEGLGGVVKFANVDDIKNQHYFQIGVFANFWLPRTNEKIYFRTGLLYTQVEGTNGKKYGFFKVPAHIGYLAPKTYRIRPSVSIGLLSPSYSGGAIVKINDKISIGVQSWVNFYFNKIPWVPAELYNYSMLANLYFEL